MSSAATVLQVVQTVSSVTVAVYQYASSVSDAEDSRQKLLNELIAIGGILTAIQALIQGPLLSNNTPEGLQRSKALTKLWNGNLVPCKTVLDGLLNWLTADTKEKMGLGKKMLWPFKEKKIGEAIAKLERYKSHLTLTLSVESWDKLDQIEKVVVDIAREQEQGKYDRKAQADKLKREDLIRWLQPVDCSDKHATSARQRQSQTCTWLFGLPKFISWRLSPKSFLWLHGKPGSGKTILASAVIDELQADPRSARSLVYFYCDFRDARRNDGATVLRSILAQLLRSADHDWLSRFPELVQRNSQGLGFPTDTATLCNFILRASRLIDSPLVVIDALDECEGIDDILSHLVRLADEGDIRLFLTSRKEQAIVDAFRDRSSISLNDTSDFTKMDMRMHISKELSTRPRLSRLPRDLKEEISSTLLAKADGMFRWVQCQLDSILACRTVRGIRDALSNLPRGLYETYDRILLSIEERGPEDSRIAQQSLMWLIGALTPLTLSQLAEALKIECDDPCLNDELGVINPDDILDVCGSLVDYNPETGITVLSHYSVQEYLTLDHIRTKALASFRISLSDAHTQLAILSISYLLCVDVFADEPNDTIVESEDDDNSRMSLAFPRHPMLLYAVHYGLDHLGHIVKEDDRVLKYLEALQVKDFSHDGRHLTDILPTTAWWTVKRRWLDEKHHSPLWIPLSLGRAWLVNRVLQQLPDLNKEIGGDWGAPLVIAIWANRTDTADLLLDKGADVNNPVRIMQATKSPLAWAALYDLDELVDLFLRRGARLDPNILHSALTPIHHHTSAYVLRKLLEHGADVTVTNYGETPMHVHLHHPPREDEYSLEITQILVEGGCDVRAQNFKGRTPLHIALNYRCVPVIEYLLSKGAQFSDARHIYQDNLNWAADKSWFPALSEAIQTAEICRSVTVDDVHKVKAMLCKRLSLPVGIIKHIMDLGEYWACASVRRDNCPGSTGPLTETNSPVFLSVQVPGVSNKCVRRLAFSWKIERAQDECQPGSGIGRFGGRLTHEDGVTEDIHLMVTCPHYAELQLEIINDVWDSRELRSHELLEQLRPGDTLSFHEVWNSDPHEMSYFIYLQVDLYYVCW
ncbi:hypothetical protein BJ138DRAFT_1113828 [Hygrophoropsis aurantiaca]|uniref:Uncharacterized protein n=1 Tax=Hygrophoropsis aurantiaca TaxID=72124 RepID=A0ACB8AB86_9AGAM|nr:hypothetical protein BJ138DRAFT_1113828 [Hygrophoropsis aurantiaca]